MLMTDYPKMLTAVEYQIADDYSTDWGTQRFEYHTAEFVPSFYLDGVTACWPPDTYELSLLERQAVPTDVTIELLARQVSGNEYQCASHICIEPGGEAKTVRMYMVQVLDQRTEITSYARNTFMQAADEADITLEPGQCTSIVNTFLLDDLSMSRPEFIRFIAWAQEPLASGPAEIHQGRSLLPPFDSYEDCNDNGVPDNWDIADETSEDLDGDGIPDECQGGCPADITGDEVVDVLDLLGILSAWGQSSVPEDVNGDGIVNMLDLLDVCSAWGPC